MLKFRPVLLCQLLLLALSLFAIGETAVNFPYPSPLIKPFLSPKLRWPTEQIVGWVESQQFDPAYQKFFYRDPDRIIPGGANLVSAADGLLGRIAYRAGITYFVIKLSFWDVHVVRTPIAGVVTDVEPDGVYYQKNPTQKELDDSIFLHDKDAPVQQIVTLQTGMGQVKVRLITSYWASRIKVWVHPGERLIKGQRIGRMLLGSTVVVELPGTVKPAVEPLVHVTGGETILCANKVAP